MNSSTIRFLKDEIGFNGIYPIKSTMDHHSSFVAKLTKTGIDVAKEIMKNSPNKKKRKRNSFDEVDSKSHLCLLCFNEGNYINDCFLMMSDGSTGNLNRHLLQHKITRDDIKLSNADFKNKFKKDKLDLFNNIADLDLYLDSSSCASAMHFKKNYK